MNKSKAITSFAKVKAHELAEVAQNIVKLMTKNPNFKTPTPPLETIQSAITAYADSLLKCQSGSKFDTSIKNANKQALEELLTNLGYYVNLTANGDALKIEGAGFTLVKERETIGILPPPDYLHVTDGENHGEFYVESAHVPKATGYQVLYAESPAPEDDSKWQVKTFSKSKGTIIGLARGKKYILKAAATSAESNRLGHYNYCQSVERITQ